MKHVLLFFAIAISPRVHAELEFDKWQYAELVVTGLKAAGQGNYEMEKKTLEQLRQTLAILNLEINRLHPDDRDAGLAAARDVLIPPIVDAWTVEAVTGRQDAQRRYLDRLFEAGLGESIEQATAELRTKAVDRPFDSLRPKHWFTAGGVGAGFLGGGILISLANSHLAPLFISMMFGGLAMAGSATALGAGRARRDHRYRVNFISPAFRECELKLLHPPKTDSDEGDRVSRET